LLGKKEGFNGILIEKENRLFQAFDVVMMKKPTGFTLIELIITVTILAIVASVAIPAFQTIHTRAKNSSVKGALNAVRSAISLYHLGEIAQGRSLGSGYSAVAGWPEGARLKDIQEDLTAPKVMESGDMPDNIWAKDAGKTNFDGIVVLGDGGPCPTGVTNGQTYPLQDAGWVYDACDGRFWANSFANKGPTYLSLYENEF